MNNPKRILIVAVGIKALRPDPLQNYFNKLADDLPPTLTAPTNGLAN